MAEATSKRVRYALVGLGDITQEAALPAFGHCEHAQVTAFVSGDPEKHREIGQKHGVSRLYSYQQFEECLQSGEVDAVYIGLPNHLHREYTERAARLGKHVLCEKPMAPTASDCRAMIEAAERGGVKLMIAYRLHFEAANMEAVRIGNSGEIGQLRFFSSSFSQQVKGGNVRVTYPTAEGGGPVFDMGVYCINAARYLFQAEPTEVLAASAKSSDGRFEKRDEMVAVTMKFPEDRLGQFTVSFGANDIDVYSLCGTEGSLTMKPAYGYVDELEQTLVKGKDEQKKTFPRSDHFAAEIDYFSECILDGQEPEPNGEEGLIDVVIVEAIHQSALSGRPVSLQLPQKKLRPIAQQVIFRPPLESKPKTINPSSPGR